MGSQEDFLNKQVIEREEEQRLYNRTMHELRTEERFTNLLNDYHADSVEQFIKHYAMQKVFWSRYRDAKGRHARQMLDQERKEVVDHLRCIMEKKVFNLKCRWVAGELDVDGIECSAQFTAWQTNEKLLNAVGPITAKEFYCYLDWYDRGSPEYLDENGHPHSDGHSAIAYYHHMRTNYHDECLDHIPQWFWEYDHGMGTRDLHLLPTTRTDMEQDHLDQYITEIFHPSLTPEQRSTVRFADRATRKRLKEDAEFKKEWMAEGERMYAERMANTPQYESFSIYNRKLMDEVVSAVETRDVQRAYRLSLKMKEMTQNDDKLFKELKYLEEIEEPLGMETNDDYAEGIRNAYRQHARGTMRHALVLLFEEYEHTVGKGLPFDWGMSDAYQNDEEPKRILAIRKLKGLPENFDFLKKENLP